MKHSLINSPVTNTHRQNRLTPYFLVLVFVGPVLAATVLYLLRDTVHFKTTQSGELLSPPIDSKMLSFFDPALLGKWQFIYVGSKTCDKACEITLSSLNIIQTALGKEKYRVQIRTVFSGDLPSHILQDGIGIIDPKGWLMMYYPPHSDFKGILRDMRRLLGGGTHG